MVNNHSKDQKEIQEIKSKKVSYVNSEKLKGQKHHFRNKDEEPKLNSEEDAIFNNLLWDNHEKKKSMKRKIESLQSQCWMIFFSELNRVYK